MTIGLGPGRWVTVGLTKKWVSADPDQPFWDLLAENLAADGFIDLTPVTGDLCEACGCLLAPGESCPSCFVWATRDAVRASWRPIPYVPPRIEEVAA